MAMPDTVECLRNSSRAKTLERWTSTMGSSVAASASRNDDARVGETAGVDEDAVRPGDRLLDAVDQRPFVIALKELDVGCRAPSRWMSRSALTLVEGSLAVDLRFAGSQEVEIGAVNHLDLMRIRHESPPAAETASLTARVSAAVVSPASRSPRRGATAPDGGRAAVVG